MAQTALGAALERVGIRAELVEFDKAIAKLLNSGGTIDDARERVEMVAKRLTVGDRVTPAPHGAGHGLSSDRQQNGETGLACGAVMAGGLLPVSSLDGDAGRAMPATMAVAALPASPPNRDEAGRFLNARSGQPVTVRPVREPTELQRKVMGHVGKVLAGFSLETYRVRDGRLLAKVKRGELGTLARTNRNEAMYLEMLRLYLDREHPGGDMLAEVGDLIAGGDAVRLFDRSKEMADAA